jgi:phosphohistidine phosphatase SixA
LLSQSYKATGAFGNIIGNPGGLSAPAVWNVPGDEETVLPLEAFVSIRAQTVLASNGIIAFGSGKNSDRVVLSHTPTLRDSQSAVPLAAQIHTGKIVRFAVWVSDQITRQSTHEEIRKIYEEAAGVFLFGHLPPKMAELTAQLWPEENNPKIRVSAQMAPQLLGTHLVVVFNLPIRA